MQLVYHEYQLFVFQIRLWRLRFFFVYPERLLGVISQNSCYLTLLV
jgi:hypothetical protein